jgi:Helix-turn-helix domain
MAAWLHPRQGIAMKTYQPTSQQREILLSYLLAHHRITTLEARTSLDILHPAGRILELRKDGKNIITHWTTQKTPKGKHRIAQYVLLSGGSHE